MKPIRVFVADGSPVVRRNLPLILEQDPDIRVVGAALSQDRLTASTGAPADKWRKLVADLSETLESRAPQAPRTRGRSPSPRHEGRRAG